MPFCVFEDGEEFFNRQEFSLFNISESAFKSGRTYNSALTGFFSVLFNLFVYKKLLNK